ncbi:hypothetical protein [Sphingobium fluviale]|uniref:Linalool dehydratase/isomerase domain-containing protein n=1 Tax=Sphingobium fluviale TaxID=2506423 RepID=A0A4Q1KN27_9SPHN|nr:hypothetical protein [Sphingobium fluviale]RXR30850.1 hypothetical protein EQG66_00725 [Sphingobium fluviale]
MSPSMLRTSVRIALSGRGSVSPFLPINFTTPSSLYFADIPVHRARQARVLFIYAILAIVAEGIGLSGLCSSETSAALLGLAFPGAGFLHWVSGGQTVFALGLFAGAFSLFGIALLLWFGTGNVLAPVTAWMGLAVLAASPRVLNLAPPQDGGGHWPWLLAPMVLLLAAIGWCRAATAASSAEAPATPCFASPGPVDTIPNELSHDDSKRLRLLLDRALQPVERFDGFERRDPFQTAALRYQVNFMAYALAFARERHAPAARACFGDAQQHLLTKIGDRRLWSYWRLENAWGNLRLDGDPVTRQNIMYSGFTALQMALGGGEALHLHTRGRQWRSYGLDDVSERLARQYRTSSYGLLDCEPNWIYPLCNLITMAGIKAADARLGTGRWEGLATPFLASLEREGMRADGTFIAFRSSLTGFAPPAPGGIVMQAFPCLFLNALSPGMAQQQWHRVRQRLDRGSWRRLFWPVDVGNYGFSRASSYAATAAAAVEMGDHEVAAECLRRLEAECPSRESVGVVHRENTSLWAHALELVARCNRADGLRELTTRRCEPGGPYLSSAPYPDVVVARAVQRDRGLDLTLDPGRPEASPLLEFGGLLPERHYRTGMSEHPFLRSDSQGRGLLRIAPAERTRITLDPVI